MNKAILKKIEEDYAREIGWKSWRDMCENVNIVSRDVGVIAERYAQACNMAETGGVTGRTKIDAIKVLENAFKVNEAFRKAFTDYIEMDITEAMDEQKIPLKKIEKVRVNAAKKIMRLYDAAWWEHQDIDKMESKSKALRAELPKK